MSLTREQFYNKAVRPNLARFSSVLNVRVFMTHLPCLTVTDREEIEAKREISGNYTAVQTLLDNLRRRDNWPEDFIIALQNCEHFVLYNEMKTAYDEIRGISKNAVSAAPVSQPAPTPAPPYSSAGAAATVTTATIHTVPATTSPLLIPAQKSANLAPNLVPAPSNIATPEPSPDPVLKVPETQQVQKPPTPVPAPSLEPVSQAGIAPLVVAPSQAPPPAAVPTHTGPAENKTPVLDTPGGLALTDQTTTLSSTDETLLSTSSAQASSLDTSQIQIAKPYASEKLPVQDTNPPLREERTIQEPEEISDTIANEPVQRNNTVGLPVLNGQTNSTGQATSSAPTEVVMHPPPSVSEEFFSKPGILQYPEPQQNRAETLPVLQEEPCSMVSGDLEISRATASSTESSLAEQTSAHIAAPSTLNQPEEDHYESLCESQTLTNVIRFAEEPPAENLNGQPPSMMQRSRVLSEDQRTLNHISTENVVPLNHPSGHNSEPSDPKKPTTINYREQESNAMPATILHPEQREEGRPDLFRINNFQLIAAAGIALSAVFLAWKLKH